MTDFATRFGPWAVVTGASSGIGEAFARRLAARGVSLVLVARREDRLNARADELAGAHGVEAHPVPLDLTADDFLPALAAATDDLDIGQLVNNAGVLRAGRFLDHDLSDELGQLSLNVRAPLVLPGGWFSPAATLAAVAAERCTALYGVPTMFRAVLDDPAFDGTDVSSLRTGIMAGAPCPVELMRRVVDRLHMPEVAVGYGMSETSPISAISARDDALADRVGTVGRVLPHLEISVRDPATGRVLPRGVPGEFCTRGYSVMRGYWRDEAATRAAIDPAGWMRTGDQAVMREDGYVRITGRLKDLIIRGGENVSPREVEEVLLGHPAVREAQVVGVPCERYGEEVMAWVRLAPGEATDAEGLRAYCGGRLAGYKVPRRWRFVDSFPMTVTGKVQKYRLRELAAERPGDTEELAVDPGPAATAAGP